MTPHAALAPYRAWIADGAHGPDPIEVAGEGGHCPPIGRHPIFAYSADLECAHGRVPIEGCEHDCHAPKPLAPLPAWARPKETPDLMDAMKPKSKPAPVPPTLAKVISDLDSEIVRLTEARDRLEGVANLPAAA